MFITLICDLYYTIFVTTNFICAINTAKLEQQKQREKQGKLVG